MIIAPHHPQEDERLKALHDLEILDTAAEASYDELVELAAMIAGTPIALISMVDADRQWFKARHGLDATQTPRSESFCAHAILKPKQPLIVSDTLRDERFVDNPLVTGAPNIRFYAGIPLHAGKPALPLGTLCVIDDKPKELGPMQLDALSKLARQVERTLLLRDYSHQLSRNNRELDAASQAKSRFLATMSHDIRTPLNGIIGSIECLNDTDFSEQQARHALGVIGHCSSSLLNIINNILDLSKIEAGRLELVEEIFDLRAFVGNLRIVISPQARDKQLDLLVDIDPQSLPRSTATRTVSIKSSSTCWATR